MKEPVPRKEPPDLDDLESEIAAVAADISSLHSAVHSLPAVDDAGRSECPFAEELYAKKEVLQQKVAAHIGRLYDYLGAVEAEIQRLRKNLTVISAHEEMISSDGVRQSFTDAEVNMAALGKRYVQMRERLKETIEDVHRALMDASAKSWPGGMPQPRSESPSSSAVQHSQDEEREIDDLFEFDRRRVSQRKPR